MQEGNGSPNPRPIPPPNLSPNLQTEALGYEGRLTPPQLDFRDQRGGLKTMGIILIVLGGFCGCLTALTPLQLMAPKMPGVPAPSARDIAGALLVYALAATLLITLGAGSLRVRRWVRPAVMVVAGTWAASGILGFVSWLFFGPNLNAIIAASTPPASIPPAATVSATTLPAASTLPTTLSAGALPGPATMPAFGPAFGPSPVMAQTISWVSGIFMVAFLILLPAGIFWFYRRHTVRQTLDYFDPAPTWTDRCPTPLLGLSFWLLLASIMTFNFCAWGVVPLFGRLVNGPAAVGVLVGAGVILLALAAGVYRRRELAWWATAAFIIVAVTSAVMTFSRVDPLDLYRMAHAPPEQIDLMVRIGANTGHSMVAGPLLYGLAAMAYLLWSRKFFKPSAVNDHL